MIKDFIFLRPVNLKNKMRLGNLSDGGYVVYQPVLCETDVLMTYGVGWDVAFEVHFYNLTRKRVWMYDPSMLDVDSIESYSNNEKTSQWRQKLDLLRKHGIYFVDEGISTVQKPKYSTFENHLKTNQITNERIMLKIDIEGDEYDIFTDDSFYDRLHPVNQIIVEFHDLKNKADILEEIISRLKREFEIVHIHGNNHGNLFVFRGESSTVIFPDVVEITFVRRACIREEDIIVEPVSYPVIGLDYPNNSGKKDYGLIFC